MLQVEARVFRTLPADSRNLVEFVSDATLEKVVGRTSAVQGSVDLQLDNLLTTQDGSFECDLTTIDTGISLRNQHMRQNHLETDHYPKALFTLSRLVSAEQDKLEAGQSTTVLAEGELTLHGVTRTYQIPLVLFYDHTSRDSQARLDGGTGDILRVSGSWTVKLADHGISRPAFLFLRLAEEIKIMIDCALTDQVPEKS